MRILINLEVQDLLLVHIFECGMALAWGKPLVLIVPEEEYERWSKHPFTAQSCAIFKSVDEFLNSKILNWFYKRTNTAIYDWKL